MTVADREEKIATQLQPRLQQISPLGRFYAGVCAGVLATTLTYPLDFVRCRLSMQRADKIVYAGIVDGLVKVYRSNGGILSLYQGIVPTIIGIVPYAGIQVCLTQRHM